MNHLKRVDIALIATDLKCFLPQRYISLCLTQHGRWLKHPKPRYEAQPQTYPTKEWSHKWHKWDYKPLPTPTLLNENKNPLFAVRPPTFKLTKRTGNSRKELREKAAQISYARKDPELERLARNRELLVCLDDVEADWRADFGLADIEHLASFYGIDRDMFGGNKIDLNTWLDVSFEASNIHRGNIVKASELLTQPTNVTYSLQKKDELTSVMVVNLDSHPLHSSQQLLHWMVCNIPAGGDATTSGDILMEYLPPLAWEGAGYQRHVFVVCEQSGPVDASSMMGDSNTLEGRSVSVTDIWSQLGVTPVGLAWCQVVWDESVTDTCAKLTDLNGEPKFGLEQYDDPKTELRKLRYKLRQLEYRDVC